MSTVLRDTYILLAATLGVTALMAALSARAHVGGLGSLMMSLLGLGALFATMYFRKSGWGLFFIFVFTGLEGLSLGPTLNFYLRTPHGAEVVGLAAGLTAGVFVALSGYVLVTKKDFSFLGGMLFVGLWLLLLSGLVLMFVDVPAASLTWSAVSVLLFSGYVLYDTSEIVRGGERNYIIATVQLYLDVLNLFLSLLRVVSALRD
ncbi:Bax inhibitor-1 family protein [Paraburkholderia sp. UCT31]|uniref:Bax inhibitor-1 family protein n=1 Tax=Paraburkholderia sp. UCT31 TaxID=2615209 RepID=UPI001CA4260D|nr:Bax inhibitor-1 family protein [Paraburkholderia sp. UCT31]